MKALLLPLSAVALLAGCATYGDPYGYGYYGHPAVYPAGTVYYQSSPTYTYPYGSYGTYGSYPYGTYHVQPDGRQYRDRDRDRDGIPNRLDADRDGDGVPNHRDARPNDPRYR